MKTKRNSGFTLVEMLVALVLGLLLIAALFLIAGKGNVFYKITSTQNSLQQVGEYILNDISREVSGAQRVVSIDPDKLSLMYIPAGVIGTATTTYEKKEYYSGATTWYVNKNRLGSGIPTTEESYLGDPRQLTNVERIKFNYYDANGSIPNNAGVVKIVETVLTLSSRKPDKTRQRLQLSARTRLPSNEGIIFGYCNNKNRPPALLSMPPMPRVIVSVYKSGLFASKDVAKDSDGAYIFSVPFSFTSQDTYSLYATPQITDPYTESIYKTIEIGLNKPHTNFLLLPEEVQDERNFIMAYDDALFIAWGKILFSDNTQPFTVWSNDLTHKGPLVELTVNPTGVNNYPVNTFYLWGKLKKVRLTGGLPGSLVTIRIKKISDGTEVDTSLNTIISTDGSGNGETAVGAFAALKLFSYTTPLAGFAKIAAYRESSPGAWSYEGLATSELNGTTHRYYFEKLPKFPTVGTTTNYRFIFVRDPPFTNPEVIYYIQADGSANKVNLVSASGIGIEPGTENLEMDYPY